MKNTDEFARSLKVGDRCYMRYATGPQSAQVVARREILLQGGLVARSIDILSSVDGGYPRSVLEDDWDLLYPDTSDGASIALDDSLESYERFKARIGVWASKSKSKA